MQDIEPEHWASHLWKFSHMVAAALPPSPNTPLSDELKQSSVSFVHMLCYLLPCSTCRDHFIEFVQALPPKFETGEDVRMWWLKCHNYINRMLGKPEWGIDQLRQTYSVSPETSATLRNTFVPSFSSVRPGNPASVPRSVNSAPTYPMQKFVPKTSASFDMKQYMTSVAGQGGKWRPTNPSVARNLNGIRRNPISRTMPTVTTYGNSQNNPTNRWRANMQQKTGAGTGRPLKKKGCKKCGKR
jgi:hypothetical protein